MKILIANAGSSSFKCQIYEMPAETVMTDVLVERVGTDKSTVEWIDRSGQRQHMEVPLADHAAGISLVMEKLTDPDTGVIPSYSDLDAVAFKPSIGDGITGCQLIDEKVMTALAEYSDYVSALHNKICIKAIESFRNLMPDVPMIAHFETFFHQNWPEYARIFAIPWDLTQKYDARRRMGHGASHYYVNRRVAELTNRKVEDFNAVQLHLGGSSSMTTVKGGVAIDGTGGFSMQTGMPMSVFASDVDGYLLGHLIARGEGSFEEIIHRMLTEGGLSGISGMGFDMRDLQEAAENGHERAQLAIDTYVYQARKFLGSFLLVLGHTDIITLAGGTGENNVYIRKRILENLQEFGIILDDQKNEACIGKEGKISSNGSRIEVWVVPTNEGIVIARACMKLLESKS